MSRADCARHRLHEPQSTDQGSMQAMFVDFGLAQQYGGSCYLRFDDTNPEAEKQEFIDHIQDIVAWLGWTPWKARLPGLWQPQRALVLVGQDAGAWSTRLTA